MTLKPSFALLVGAVALSAPVHGQNPQDVQRQYQEQQRERQERDRQEQRNREVQRDHDQLMGQYDRDRNRNSSATANQGGNGAPSAVGTVIALGVAVTVLEALSRASQHRTLIGNTQPMTRLCLVHPMTRWPAQVYYQWSGEPTIYSISLRSTYNSGREEYTLLSHPSAKSVRVQLTPFEADDPPKVFELFGLPDSFSESCRSLPTYAWRFGRGAAVNTITKTQALR